MCVLVEISLEVEDTKSVAERTESEKHIVDVFRGVNDIVDELKLADELTPWSHGGYYNERAEFERLKGKKLNSSNSTGGHILTLQQVVFADKDVLLVHQSSNWLAETDLSELTSTEPDPPVSPLEPFIPQ